MSSTPDSFERSRSPNQPGGDGSYASSSDQDSSLRVQLGEHLDERTRDEMTGEELIRERLDRTIGDSLQSLERAAHSMIEYVKKNPLPVIAAIGGIAACCAQQSTTSLVDRQLDQSASRQGLAVPEHFTSEIPPEQSRYRDELPSALRRLLYRTFNFEPDSWDAERQARRRSMRSA